MQITFRTITQQTFKLDFEPSVTVGDIKQKISEEKGTNDFAVESQKLIYNGKILENSQTVEELNIDDKKFIVVMVSRKPAPAPSTTTSNSASDADSKPLATESMPKDSTSPEQQKAATNASSVIASTASAPGDSDDFPEQHREILNNIMLMGYSREDSIRALKAAFYNADRAVEYLCTGIPETVGQNPLDESAEDDEEDAEGAHGLEWLQHSPQFQQLRDLVRQQPHLLQQIVTQIAGTNPTLMNAIRNNQEAFLQLINADPSESGSGASPAIGGRGTVGGSHIGRGTGGGTPPGVVTINVTQNDRDAIERLKALGFAEQLVIEAYFACDKNEDLAANYILARMDEFHDEIGNATGGGSGQ